MEKLTNREVLDSYELDKSEEDFEITEFNARSIETGEWYWPLTKNPEIQQMVALLIKSVIPTADVIKIGEKTYSKQIDMPVGYVEAETPQIQAEWLFLDYIFHDYDHSKYRNIKELTDTHYHFDFDVVYNQFLSEQGVYVDADKLPSDMSQDVVEILFDINEKFSKQLEGKQGEEFVDAILKKVSNADTILFKHPTKNEDIKITGREIHELLLRRSEDLSAYLEDLLGAGFNKQAA